jgi:mannose-6-phosphate isomerase-like protein (cupin superfamily)
MFHVEHGELQVFIHHTNGLVDETTLKSGDSCQVAPGMLHRFSAVGCTVAYEVYWPAPIDSGDIQREDTGGIRE